MSTDDDDDGVAAVLGGEAIASGGSNSSAVGRKQLQSIVERIERLEEDKKAIADDIKEVYKEAKGNGFDTKTIRRVIQRRKKPTEEWQEEEALLDLYLNALGMAVGD